MASGFVRGGGSRKHQTPLDRLSVLVSVSGHLLLLSVLALLPTLRSGETLPAVLEVSLVVDSRAISDLADEDASMASNTTPAVRPKKVVIPKESTKVIKPDVKPESVMNLRDQMDSEVDLEDLLAKLRREEATSDQVHKRAGRTGFPISANEAAWRRRAKVHVTRNWILAPGFRLQLLKTEVLVKVAKNGLVQSILVTQRSGNPWFDESVERAIRKSSPLPVPDRPGKWTFVFSPEDRN